MRRIETSLPAHVRRACSSAMVHLVTVGAVSDRAYFVSDSIPVAIAAKNARSEAAPTVENLIPLPCRSNLLGGRRRLGRSRGLNPLAGQEFRKSGLLEGLSFVLFFLDLTHIHQVRRYASFSSRPFIALL